MTLPDGRIRRTIQPDYSTHDGGRGAGKGQGIIENKPRLRSSAQIFPAVTEYRVLKSFRHTSLLEVKPVTGYKHQIRVHLALGLGCPVIGDHKYTNLTEMGKPQKLSGETLHLLGIRQSKARDLSVMLHAKHVQVPEIVAGKQVWADAPLPHHFNRVIQSLKLKPDKFVAI